VSVIDKLADAIIDRGDLAHLALIVWGGGATFMALAVSRRSARRTGRFDDFVRELQRFNRRLAEILMTSFLHWVGLAPRAGHDAAAAIRAFVHALARLHGAHGRTDPEVDDHAV
jgi:hypothetical protein